MYKNIPVSLDGILKLKDEIVLLIHMSTLIVFSNKKKINRSGLRRLEGEFKSSLNHSSDVSRFIV